MIVIDEDIRVLIQSELDSYTQYINQEAFRQAKDIMNKYFGEENNQIARPTVEDVDRYIRNNIASDMSASRLRRYIDADSGDYTTEGGPTRTQRTLFGSMKVYIRFPELTITNGRRNKGHLIKDLWVRFNVDEKFRPSNLSGARSTLSIAEATAGYRHSHLRSKIPTSTTEPPNFGDFCLGTGEILQVMRLLSANGFDVINFTLFCLHLKNFVVWESLDGNPYMHYEPLLRGITRQTTTSNERMVASLNEHVVKKAIEVIKEIIADGIGSDTEPYYKERIIPVIVKDEVRIENNEELELMLSNVINAMSTHQVRRIGITNRQVFFVKKNMNGDHIHFDQTHNENSEIRVPSNPIFTFKGQPIYLTIEGMSSNTSINSQNQNHNVYAHPQITEQFCKSFTSDFAEVLFRVKEAIQTNTIKNILQTTGSDLLPMLSGT